jgi:hypothetical protein
MRALGWKGYVIEFFQQHKVQVQNDCHFTP